MSKRVLFGLAVLAADVALICYLLSHGQNSVQYMLGQEASKITFQLILVVLFGGILIQEYNRRRARQDAVNEFKRDILRDLSRAYSEAKGVRRILRAKCVRRGVGENEMALFVPVADYDEHIAKLNATQLTLEVIVRELRIIKEGFDEIESLIGHVRAMEKYLGRIVDEYEDAGDKRAENFIALRDLERLHAFIVKSRTGSIDDGGGGEVGFKASIFFKSYQDALTIIGRERVKLV